MKIYAVCPDCNNDDFERLSEIDPALFNCNKCNTILDIVELGFAIKED